MSTYVVSQTVTLEWPITDPDGNPVTTGVTVTGSITRPDLTTAPLTGTHVGGGLYRASYDPLSVGAHSWRLEATGAVDGARTGSFLVVADPGAGPGPNLDPATPIGLVRLLIPDKDPSALLFTDTELAALIALEGGNARRGAAQALEVAASNEAMVSKVIRTQDLSTDGPAVAAEYRARAAILRSQAAAAEDEEEAASTVGAFTIRPYGQPDCQTVYRREYC